MFTGSLQRDQLEADSLRFWAEARHMKAIDIDIDTDTDSKAQKKKKVGQIMKRTLKNE